MEVIPRSARSKSEGNSESIPNNLNTISTTTRYRSSDSETSTSTKKTDNGEIPKRRSSYHHNRRKEYHKRVSLRPEDYAEVVRKQHSAQNHKSGWKNVKQRVKRLSIINAIRRKKTKKKENDDDEEGRKKCRVLWDSWRLVKSVNHPGDVKPWVVHPNSKIAIFYSYFMSLFTLIVAAVIPVELAFERYNEITGFTVSKFYLRFSVRRDKP